MRGARERRRHGLQHRLRIRLPSIEKTVRRQLRRAVSQRAYRRRNRHVVVVQHDEKAQVVASRQVVHRLESDAGAQRAVADHRHAMPRFAVDPGGMRHAEHDGDRCAGVRGAERVVRRFAAARKTGNAAALPQCLHRLAPTGQDLVRIGLVPDVPDDAIARRIEYVVQRDGQFDGTEIGGKMPAGGGDVVQHEIAQLGREIRQLCARELLEVGRRVDCTQGVHVRIPGRSGADGL